MNCRGHQPTPKLPSAKDGSWPNSGVASPRRHRNPIPEVPSSDDLRGNTRQHEPSEQEESYFALRRDVLAPDKDECSEYRAVDKHPQKKWQPNRGLHVAHDLCVAVQAIHAHRCQSIPRDGRTCASNVCSVAHSLPAGRTGEIPLPSQCISDAHSVISWNDQHPASPPSAAFRIQSTATREQSFATVC